VLFDYRPEASAEFSKVNASFPVPLSDDNYLDKVSIQTESYKQTFKFDYKVNNNKQSFDQALGGNSSKNILNGDQ
jgi:hypothetical protein